MKLITIIFVTFFVVGCTPGFDPVAYQKQFEVKTGLKVYDSDSSSGYLSKIHRGYPLLVHTKMGDVWGRFGARVAASQIGPELGHVGRFLTGSYESGVGGVTGSPFDRALSKVIGQPISLFMILKHGLKNVPELDIVSRSSTIRPERQLSKVGNLGNILWGEEIFGDNILWQKLKSSKPFIERISRLRSHYIMVDENAVTFMFAGTETDYSGMINEFPSYEDFMVAIMDSLADMADLLTKN